MNTRPRIKSCYLYEVLAPHGVLLLSERGQFFLRGKAYREVVPYLDGQHTTDDIVRRLEGRASEPEVIYAVELLTKKGYVVEGGVPISPPDAAFWETLGLTPEVVARRRAEASVSVRALGSVRKAPFELMLEELGLRTAEQGDFDVVLTDDYLQEGLGEINREALASGRPWMLVRPVGVEIWLGPIFVPGKTGCHACLSHFLGGHRKAETYIKEKRGLAGPLVLARAALTSTASAALGLAATEVAKWVLKGSSEALEGRIVTFDMISLERAAHTLIRRPQCPVCGDPAVIADGQRRPMALEHCRASFTHEGGYRRSSPEEMLARHEHRISPITGLVGHLKRMLHKSASELTISYVADHNFAHIDEDLFFLREGQRSHSGGKGKSDAQARASALGESMERYSALFQGDEARISARLADLGPGGIHPNACMLFSDRQIAERERWNQGDARFTRVPGPFDPAAEIEWSPLFSIRGKSLRYLPTAYCYFGYGRRQAAGSAAARPDRGVARPSQGSDFTYSDSNGCAAGATPEEAVFQGLLELCERDATAVWWYNRIRRPGVDLESFGDPYYGELLAYYRSIHRSVWALDLTHDLGIPTFAALSRRTDKKAQDIIFGLGSHLDPKIALLRAVTELNQFLPSVIDVTERSEEYRWYEMGVRFFKTATLESDPYLAPDESTPLRKLADYPQAGTGDLYEDILHCVGKLEQQGLEPLVLDLTRPETGLHVARVVVPGLRHFWARLAPGRLYDVPVQLGWLPQRLREEELNPFPIFF